MPPPPENVDHFWLQNFLQFRLILLFSDARKYKKYMREYAMHNCMFTLKSEL